MLRLRSLLELHTVNPSRELPPGRRAVKFLLRHVLPRHDINLMSITSSVRPLHKVNHGMCDRSKFGMLFTYLQKSHDILVDSGECKARGYSEPNTFGAMKLDKTEETIDQSLLNVKPSPSTYPPINKISDQVHKYQKKIANQNVGSFPICCKGLKRYLKFLRNVFHNGYMSTLTNNVKQ